MVLDRSATRLQQVAELAERLGVSGVLKYRRMDSTTADEHFL